MGERLPPDCSTVWFLYHPCAGLGWIKRASAPVVNRLGHHRHRIEPRSDRDGHGDERCIGQLQLGRPFDRSRDARCHRRGKHLPQGILQYHSHPHRPGLRVSVHLGHGLDLSRLRIHRFQPGLRSRLVRTPFIPGSPVQPGRAAHIRHCLPCDDGRALG